MGLNRARVGHRYEQVEPFEVTADRARAYADASGAADIEAYRGGVVPPMYGVAFSFGALTAPLLDGELGVDLTRLVHGEQDMRFLGVVRPGDVVRSQATLRAIEEKSSGEVMTLDLESAVEGRSVLESTSTLFVRGRRKRGGEAKPAAADPFAGLAPWFVDELTVAEDQSRRYAEASGDRNPIHTDDEAARMAGLPGVILHGLCTMAFVHNALVRHAEGDTSAVRRLAVRFRRPVLMGDTLAIEARGSQDAPALRVTNQAGVVVLTGGRAELG